MKDDKIDLEKISKKDLLTELRIHMMSFNRRMGKIKDTHKLLLSKFMGMEARSIFLLSKSLEKY